MSLSINNNLTALAAQTALRNSDTQLSQVADQLASGQRIVNPSIDPAGLAIGTNLATAGSTLQTALSSATQAGSLLSIAAGGLSSVGSILQQMQSLAVQANSGTNSATSDGFLNEEYQALLQQINQTATATNFNGQNLIDGSLSGSVNTTTNTNTTVTAAGAAQTLFTVSATVPTDGQTITIGGQTITFSTDATKLNDVYVQSSATATEVGDNLAAFLNSSTNPNLSPFYFTDSAGAVSAQWRGGTVAAANSAITLTSAAGTYAGGTAATATIATGGSGALNLLRTQASGTIDNNILTSLSQTAGTGPGIDVSGIEANSAFVGNLITASNGGFTGSLSGTAELALSITVGNITYTGTAASALSTAQQITLTGHDQSGNALGGTFKITLSGTGGAIANASQAQSAVSQINEALAGVTISQNRTVSSYNPGGAIVTNGVTTGNLTGTEFDLTNSNFTNPQIGGITVTAPTGGNNNAVISAVVNGDTYTSIGSIGNTIAAGSFVVLADVNNPANTLVFTNGSTALQITSAAQATAAQAALQQAFGFSASNAGNGLVFQVGTSASDTVNVTLGNSTASSLGLTGTDISSQDDAQNASAIVAAAILINSGQSASIGALQSRFNFISSTLSTSIQNTQAAAGDYLSTDVSQASTQYATDQVTEEAGISVLAQLNQLPQNLLKLLA